MRRTWLGFAACCIAWVHPINVNAMWSGPGYSSFTNQAGSGLQLGMPVTVSSTSGPNAGRLAVDGDPNTRWAASGTGAASLIIDLQSPQPISMIRATVESVQSGFQCQTSDDGVNNWNSLNTPPTGYATGTPVAGARTTITCLSGGYRFARYVRIINSGYMSIWDVHVAAEAPPVNPEALPLTVVSASAVDPSNPAIGAVDRNAATRWASPLTTTSTADFLELDLGSIQTISVIDVNLESFSGATGNLLIQYKTTNADSYTTLTTLTGFKTGTPINPNNNNEKRLSLHYINPDNGTPMRFIKLTNLNNGYMSIWEVLVYRQLTEVDFGDIRYSGGSVTVTADSVSGSNLAAYAIDPSSGQDGKHMDTAWVGVGNTAHTLKIDFASAQRFNYMELALSLLQSNPASTIPLTLSWSSDDVSYTSSNVIFENQFANSGTVLLPVWLGASTAVLSNPPGAYGVTARYLKIQSTGSLGLWDVSVRQAAAVPTTAPPVVASASGDPQIAGLQSQLYQFHGSDDDVYNLISTPHLQLNAKFIYLDSGKCDYNHTACWTHPGTYLSVLGLQLQEQRIQITAGSHAQGLSLHINGKDITSMTLPVITAWNDTRLIYVSSEQVIVETPLWHITVFHSDYFFNLEVTLLDSHIMRAGRHHHHYASEFVHQHSTSTADTAIYPSIPIHGLIGQTWRNAVYGPEQHMYEGSPDSYLLESRDIFGRDFEFNKFK